jgi:phage terminase small subunit
VTGPNWKQVSAESRRWARRILSEYELSTAHVRILFLACVHWDHAQEARADIANRGALVVTGTGSPIRNPATLVLKDASLAFMRACRELNLDVGDPGGPRGPSAPGITWR